MATPMMQICQNSSKFDVAIGTLKLSEILCDAEFTANTRTKSLS